MIIVYTRHAKRRMRLREISKADIEIAITASDREKQVDGKVHFFKTIKHRVLKVVVAKEHDRFVVITSFYED